MALKVTVIVVGFKVNEDNSVYYRKVECKMLPNGYPIIAEPVGQLMETAFNRGAEFVSVRFIRHSNNEQVKL
jgi:hypothetical protein